MKGLELDLVTELSEPRDQLLDPDLGRTALEVVGAEAWIRDYGLARDLRLEGAEAAYLSGEFEHTTEWTASVIAELQQQFELLLNGGGVAEVDGGGAQEDQEGAALDA